MLCAPGIGLEVTMCIYPGSRILPPYLVGELSQPSPGIRYRIGFLDHLPWQESFAFLPTETITLPHLTYMLHGIGCEVIASLVSYAFHM